MSTIDERWNIVDTTRAFCQKVLPLVYDESLSYMELVCKLSSKLNEVIENNNNLPLYIKDLIKETVNSDEFTQIVGSVLMNTIINVKFPPEGIAPAKGDGVTDDTASIQACLDYANNQGGAVVFFPSGKYLTGTLSINTETSILGADRYNTTLVLKGGGNTPLLQGVINQSVRNISLDGNRLNQIEENYIIDGTIDMALFDNVILCDSAHCITADACNISEFCNIMCKDIGDSVFITATGNNNLLTNINTEYSINLMGDNNNWQSAQQTKIGSVEPLIYKQPVALNNSFNFVPAKTETGEEYKLLVSKNDESGFLFVNVKEYGAKGDGVTDDTAAINLAMLQKGTIYFPPGTYLISDTLKLYKRLNNSLFLDNACIKAAATIVPMLSVAYYETDEDTSGFVNYPSQIVYGNGFFDCSNNGSTAIKLTNKAVYAQITNIQVRNCSNGIGIIVGEEPAVSLQAELINVKIYGKDSALPGTALQVNAYDCVFNNIYLYLCRVGGEINHTGNTFDFVHVWCHSYNAWNPDVYRETRGFIIIGITTFKTLYLDSCYIGIECSYYSQNIDTLIYQSDITDTNLAEVEDIIIKKDTGGKVVINNSYLTNPRNSRKVKIFDITQSPSTRVVQNRNTVITHSIEVNDHYNNKDEGFNLLVNKQNMHTIAAGTATAGTKYNIGHVKLIDGRITLHFNGRFKFYSDAVLIVDTNGTREAKKEVFYAPPATELKIYYGTPVTESGVKWLPIYVEFINSITSNTLSVYADGTGETGFYPITRSAWSDLPSTTDTTLTEIVTG